jgi:hypothetical protein
MIIKVEYDKDDRLEHFARLAFWTRILRNSRMQKANCELANDQDIEDQHGTWGI